MGLFFKRMKTELIYEEYLKSTGISTDSRKVRPGEIFFALSGPHFDGNRFAAEAIAAGAACAVIDDHEYETDRTILVDDTLKELQELAEKVRDGLKAKVIAITGSNGKTTTRELIATVLKKKFKVFSTNGNLNNHIGVPLTILSCPADTEMLVVEMGASHIGEIGRLCSIAKPHIGIITNIGLAHIEGFGSFEGVRKAKSELYEYIRKTGGIAFYNEEDPILTELIYKHVVKAVPFSDPTGTDLTTISKPEEIHLSGRIIFHEKQYDFTTNLFGSHNHQNIRAAMAVGLFMDIPIGEVIEGIEAYIPSNNRSQVLDTGSNTLICDSYNANPVSMGNAILSFARLSASEKLCILGDMLELGSSTEEEHHKILKLLTERGLKKCFTVGPVFMALAPLYGFEAFDTVESLVNMMRRKPINGKTILIKGSRSIRLEKTYEVL
jgi:UDP-N-acetylmuramoyl-tripeptide--D-alanyl-D-alanine ligase